ncbi:branched-chain amino acid ABC transporter permease [Candidatus Finniella inopinata]|uniref:Branched-chain amino acid ABC transporter permease n=1 Tax=Candidatus Finniella inopinata TaxID=1696036 RepID=A0A4Q7DKA4_9PROT|nr:branched-chain amino acid ABC transporter permease [Candidatus Finniella inopinata]RZI46739.1 branched-chain amino acid ABC transporter permease [Candidatus Finniella inopinata]
MKIICGIFAILLLTAPYYCDAYVLSVLILAFYTAYVGQAWNLLLGFAGQLSFGHALYAGVGSYLAAGLFLQFGWSPWLTALPIMGLSGLLGASIGFLGFRFGVQGVYFTLLTIAFAECGRVIFDHWSLFGGAAGLFLPIDTVSNFWHLRGSISLFYYLFLGLVVAGFAVSWLFLKTRLGYFSQATRENEQAAQALGISTFWVKVKVMGLSASLTSLGGIFYAFYQNTLFPDQTLALSRSIELAMGTIVGGVGTLMGPIVGALILVPLGEVIQYVSGEEIVGIKNIFYGFCLLGIIMYIPKGIVPAFKGWRRKTKKTSDYFEK